MTITILILLIFLINHSNYLNLRTVEAQEEQKAEGGARHMGSTVWLGFWVKGGRARERDREGETRGHEPSTETQAVVAGDWGTCSLPEVGGENKRRSVAAKEEQQAETPRKHVWGCRSILIFLNNYHNYLIRLK